MTSGSPRGRKAATGKVVNQDRTPRQMPERFPVWFPGWVSGVIEAMPGPMPAPVVDVRRPCAIMGGFLGPVRRRRMVTDV